MIPAAYIAKRIVDKKAPEGTPIAQNDNDSLDEIKEKAVAIGLSALGLGAAFFVGRKIIKNIREKRTQRRFTKESQQALLLRSAMNPSGTSWLIWMDGTKEEAIFNVAAQITNFRKVQQDYQNLYNRSLVKDLQKELDARDYSKFMNIINSSGIQNSNVQGGTNTGYFPAPTNTNTGSVHGKVILIEDDTKIYEQFTWYPFGSVKKADKNYFINHLTTGEVKRLNAGYGITIPFVQVRVKTVEGMVKTVYVKQKDVKLVTKDDFIANYQKSYTKLVFTDDDF